MPRKKKKTANSSPTAPAPATQVQQLLQYTSLTGRNPRKISILLTLALTAIMLTLLFPPFYCFFLAPFALVPFCVCIIRRPMTKTYLAAYYLLGFVFFAGNLYWMAPVTIGGFLALALFVGLYFALFAIGLHRLVVHFRLPAILAVPLVWTAVEYIRASFVLGGFPWFLLGNCLTPLPLLIQAADLFGVWGLTFFIALLNGFVVDALRLPLKQQGKFSPAIRRLLSLATLTLAFVVGYGYYRLNESTTRHGPRVAVIQENIPQSLKEQHGASDDIFSRHLRLLDQAAQTQPKPDIIVWPETMVPWSINEEFFHATAEDFKALDATPEGLKAAQEDRRFVINALQSRADTYGIALLVGYGALSPPLIAQNRTVLFLPKTGRAGEYAKVHIVPFGELIPFRSIPLLKNLMMLMSPNGTDYSLTPGTWAQPRFRLPIIQRSASFDTGPTTAPAEIHTQTQIYTFGTPICFEDTMPEPARMMSAPQFADGRKADFLLNVSNDGWFQRVELDQHLQACQLRAVENRIPIARSVNTGNSGFIDSNGRITRLVRNAAGEAIGAVGTASEVLLIDSRVTTYSRIGDLFPIVCGVVSTLLIGWTFVRPRRGASPA